MLERIFKVLNRPLFGTQVIPPDAGVDPARFPEEDFPVYCPKCEYLLRGLPDGRCPECGEPFERGRLLVLEYVRWRVPRQQRYNRILTRLSVAGLSVLFVAVGVHVLFQKQVAAFVANPKTGPNSLSPLTTRWIQVVQSLMAAEIAVLAALILVGIVVAMRYRRRAAQRRSIIAAIQPRG